MSSLILSVISIILIGLLSAASLLHIGDQERSREAAAGALLNQAEQIYAARVLKKQIAGEPTEDLFELVSSSHLTEIPRPLQLGYTDPATEPLSSDWSVQVDNGPGIFLVSRIQEDVCRFINFKANGTKDIPPDFTENVFTQCYGSGPAYTFVYGATSGRNTDGSDNTQLPPDTLVSEGSTIYLDIENPNVAVLVGQPVGVLVTNDTGTPATFLRAVPSPEYESNVSLPSVLNSDVQVCTNGLLLGDGESCMLVITPTMVVSGDTPQTLLVDVAFRPESSDLNVEALPDSVTQIPLKVLPFRAGERPVKWASYVNGSPGFAVNGSLYFSDVKSQRYQGPDLNSFYNFASSTVDEFARYVPGSPNREVRLRLKTRPFGESFSFTLESGSYRPAAAETCAAKDFLLWSSIFQGSNGCGTYYNNAGSEGYSIYSLAYGVTGRSKGLSFAATADGRVLGTFADYLYVPGSTRPLDVVQAGTVEYMNTTAGVNDGRPKANFRVANPALVSFPTAISNLEPVNRANPSSAFFAWTKSGRAWVYGFENTFVGKTSPTATESSVSGYSHRPNLIHGLDFYTPGTPMYDGSTWRASALVAPEGGSTWYTSNNPRIPIRGNGDLTIDWYFENKVVSGYLPSNLDFFKERIAHLAQPQVVVRSDGSPLEGIIDIQAASLGGGGYTSSVSCAVALTDAGVVWGAGHKRCWGETTPTSSSDPADVYGFTRSSMQAGFRTLFDYSAGPKPISMSFVYASLVGYGTQGLILHFEDGTVKVQAMKSGGTSDPVHALLPVNLPGETNSLFYKVDCEFGVCAAIDSKGVAVKFNIYLESQTQTTFKITVAGVEKLEQNCSSVDDPRQPVPCPVWVDVNHSEVHAYVKGSDGVIYSFRRVSDPGLGGYVSHSSCAAPCEDPYNINSLNSFESTLGVTSIKRRGYPLALSTISFAGGYVPPRRPNDGFSAFASIVNGRLLSFKCTGPTCGSIYSSYRNR